MTMVYEVEVRGHRDVSRLLAACRLLLTTHAQHFKSRMVFILILTNADVITVHKTYIRSCWINKFLFELLML